MKSGAITNFIPHGVHEINPNPYNNLIQSITEENTEKKQKINVFVYTK